MCVVALGVAGVASASPWDLYRTPRDRGFIQFIARDQNQLRWGSQLNTVKDENNNNLPYSETDGTQGAFAQLIWVGPDGQIDDFDPGSQDGTGDDDVVVDTTYSYGSEGSVLGTFPNLFQYQAVPLSVIGEDEDGYKYYVRVFNFANPNFYTQGTTASVSSATYYYQSGTYTYDWGDPEAGATLLTFEFTEGQNRQTDMITAVPEPSTLALMGLGAAALIGARRKRKG